MIKKNFDIILKTKGISVKEILITLDISRQVLSYQLNSKNIGLQKIVKFAELLNVPTYYLLLDTEELMRKLSNETDKEKKSKDIIVICPKCKEQIKLQL